MAAEEILTTEEVAELMKVSYNTARKWIKAGRIPGREIGRVWRVVESDLLTFITHGSTWAPEPFRIERRIRAADLLGSCADISFSTADLAREHQEEIERDERWYREHFGK